jgi:hypothetical protein
MAVAVSGNHTPSTAPARRLIASTTGPFRSARYDERSTTTSPAIVWYLGPVHAAVDTAIDHDRGRVHVEGGEDALMDGALDGGCPLAHVALNLRIIHGAAAAGAVLRPLDTGHQLLYGVREGLALIGDRDHDWHLRASSICFVWRLQMVQALPSSRLAQVPVAEIPLKRSHEIHTPSVLMSRSGPGACQVCSGPGAGAPSPI